MNPFGGGDWISTLLWIIFLWIFIWIGPRLMLQQTIWNLEKEVVEMEILARKAEELVYRFLPKRGKKEKKELSYFLEFFSIPPVDLDPYGIVKKIDHILRNSEEKMAEFVRYLYPNVKREREKDFKAGLSGAIMARQIAKIVRHYLEMVKKYKNLQIALLIQMQLPMIKRLLESSVKATDAFLREIPIGDSVGPLAAAKLMKRKHKIYKEEEFVVAEGDLGGKKVFVAKAEGPGATTGYPGKFLTKFLKRNKIDRIITIDAALKLEGEKTGSVAEGVGVAMGGVGVERYEIEKIAQEKGIRLDAIIVKQSNEEALSPMKKEIFEAVPFVLERLEKMLSMGRKNEKVLIIGVGNTSGVGNDIKSAEEVERRLRNVYKKMEQMEKNKKKRKFF